jgi:hypothetical protein
MEKTQKISEKLYQFKDEIAMVIVAAKQEGRIYRASNGEIELLEEFRIPKPVFSDDEGLPEEGGHKENDAELQLHHEYLEHFEKLFRSFAPDFKPNHIYLFAPIHMTRELEGIIKPVFGPLPIKTINGIFTKEFPHEFLERI